MRATQFYVSGLIRDDLKERRSLVIHCHLVQRHQNPMLKPSLSVAKLFKFN